MKNSTDRAEAYMRKVGQCQPLRGEGIGMRTNDLDSLCARPQQLIYVLLTNLTNPRQSLAPSLNQTLHALRHSLFREAFARVLKPEKSRV
jgi:hypothetical protein